MEVLSNQVRAYPWGSTTAIPRLLGVPPSGEPQAELWIGAHERAPSAVVRAGVPRPLDAVIAGDPVAELGAELAGAELAGPGRLPFLAKVIAVERPLSLQLHPGSSDARRGFGRESAAGLARDVPERSFPDPCAKPELVYAMSDFTAVCGWRPVEEIRAVLAELAVDELTPALRELAAGADGLRPTISSLLRMTPGAAAAAVARIADKPSCPAATAVLAAAFPEDPAVLVSLMLRTVSLAPGETMYVAPGQLHCYLSGIACEVQANSDNVVRAGLTAKHVDVDQVLDLVDVSTQVPHTRRSIVGPETVYQPDVAEFGLGVIGEVPEWTKLAKVPGPALLVCLRGAYALDDDTGCVLARGQSAYTSARSGALRVRGNGILLRVTAGRAGWGGTGSGSGGTT